MYNYTTIDNNTNEYTFSKIKSLELRHTKKQESLSQISVSVVSATELVSHESSHNILCWNRVLH